MILRSQLNQNLMKGPSTKDLYGPCDKRKTQLPKEIEAIKPYLVFIEKNSQKFQVPKAFIVSVIYHESRGKTKALSPRGAIGLMQIMPNTAKELNIKNPWDAAQNIEGGTRYLKKMLDRFNGRIDLALAAYNSGPGNVIRYNGIPPFKETKNYVRNNLNSIKNLNTFFLEQNIPTQKSATILCHLKSQSSLRMGQKISNTEFQRHVKLNRIISGNPKISRQELFFRKHMFDAQLTEQMTGVPASISLAQAALASGYGKYCKKSNLFGRSSSNNRSQTFKSFLDSFMSNALTISQGKYLKKAMQHRNNAENFVDALQSGKCKYASDPEYSKKIINIINRYQLKKYDNKKSVNSNLNLGVKQ